MTEVLIAVAAGVVFGVVVAGIVIGTCAYLFR